MNSIKSSDCPRHPKTAYLYVCTHPNCQQAPLFCDQCLKTDNSHTSTHKNFFFTLTDFLNTQNGKLSIRLYPSLNQTLLELDRRAGMLSQSIENDIKEVDIDFAALFKIFFNISESAKNYLKDFLRSENKKIIEKITLLKKSLKDLQDNESQKPSPGFLNTLLSRDPDKIEANSLEELVQKLLNRNQNANKLRGDILTMGSELDNGIIPSKYKKSEGGKKIFEEIKEEFDKSCKEMYRQFKQLIQGGDPADLRKSIFAQKKTINTVSIDLSAGRRSNSPKLPNIRQIRQFPEITNPNVSRALSKFGPLNIVPEDHMLAQQKEQGPFQYEDGSVYQGHIKDIQGNLIRHGLGKLLFQDGTLYEGYWKEDAPFGFGRLIKANGDVYEGGVNGYKASGKGVLYSLDGYIYNGEWENDKKNGIGEEIQPNGTEIKGLWEANEIKNQGFIRFSDGTIYEGDIKSQKITGNGRFIYPNGDVYTGNVVNGKREGRGILNLKEKGIYEGEFSNDVCHGNGIFKWPDGLKYTGSWKNGLQHGFGSEISENPFTEKEGEWDNGRWVKWIKQKN